VSLYFSSTYTTSGQGESLVEDIDEWLRLVAIRTCTTIMQDVTVCYKSDHSLQCEAIKHR
jgi:hypothetical protein